MQHSIDLPVYRNTRYMYHTKHQIYCTVYSKCVNTLYIYETSTAQANKNITVDSLWTYIFTRTNFYS